MNNSQGSAEHERQKKIAIDFFYWWHNQPGTNTEEGFEAYSKTDRYKMLDVSITAELDAKDALMQQGSAEQNCKCFDAKECMQFGCQKPQGSAEQKTGRQALLEVKAKVAKDMGFDLDTSVYDIHFSSYTDEIAERYASQQCSALKEENERLKAELKAAQSKYA